MYPAYTMMRAFRRVAIRQYHPIIQPKMRDFPGISTIRRARAGTESGSRAIGESAAFMGVQQPISPNIAQYFDP
jgi:hypothetical protein